MGTPWMLDYETAAIEPRPHYPPKPVGVAIKYPGKKAVYFRWGHPRGNNCTKEQAIRAIKEAHRTGPPVCHHAGFDLDVQETHLGIPWPAEHHDTLLLSFLVDPDSPSLSLKPLAQRYLREPPSEQDALHDWILANIPKATKKTAGAFISLAPGDLVEPYACGDVNRTEKLFKLFFAEVKKIPQMREAYGRECRFTRTLIRMERRGVPIATRRLGKAMAAHTAALKELDWKLLGLLKVPVKQRHDVIENYDDQEYFKWGGKKFADQLLKSKLVAYLPETAKGNPSTAAEALLEVMPPKLAHEFEVRSQIATCLNTFMGPWHRMALETDGLFYARFNQVRNGDEWGKFTGARTGRLSMTPNLQNVIRSDKDARVPQLRDFVVPGPYYALAQRDYSQQELRILAHYEAGPFLASYIANPGQDAHILVAQLIAQVSGIKLERRAVKDLNFGLIYGMGIAKTAKKMGVELPVARSASQAHKRALPGVPRLQQELDRRSRNHEPIFTWGGRRYYCEPPQLVNGRLHSFEYKMLNKLIQGSAADCTKQGMLNYDALPLAEEHPMLLQVHDELINGVRVKGAEKLVHESMRDAMADVKFSVPMLTDGKLGRVSWHRMTKVAW